MGLYMCVLGSNDYNTRHTLPTVGYDQEASLEVVVGGVLWSLIPDFGII